MVATTDIRPLGRTALRDMPWPKRTDTSAATAQFSVAVASIARRVNAAYESKESVQVSDTDNTDELDTPAIDWQGDATLEALALVLTEREAQVEKWGIQNHNSSHYSSLPRSYKAQADRWKAINAARVDEGSISWDGILLEEVFEALAEADPKKRAIELVQVAAVAVAEVECILGRQASLAGKGAE